MAPLVLSVLPVGSSAVQPGCAPQSRSNKRRMRTRMTAVRHAQRNSTGIVACLQKERLEKDEIENKTECLVATASLQRLEEKIDAMMQFLCCLAWSGNCAADSGVMDFGTSQKELQRQCDAVRILQRAWRRHRANLCSRQLGDVSNADHHTGVRAYARKSYLLDVSFGCQARSNDGRLDVESGGVAACCEQRMQSNVKSGSPFGVESLAVNRIIFAWRCFSRQRGEKSAMEDSPSNSENKALRADAATEKKAVEISHTGVSTSKDQVIEQHDKAVLESLRGQPKKEAVLNLLLNRTTTPQGFDNLIGSFESYFAGELDNLGKFLAVKFGIRAKSWGSLCECLRAEILGNNKWSDGLTLGMVLADLRKSLSKQEENPEQRSKEITDRLVRPRRNKTKRAGT